MPNAIRPEVQAKLAVGVTLERVRATLDAYLATPQSAQQSRLCLRLPESQQADENSLDSYQYRGPAGGEQPAPTFTFYNLLTRTRYVGQEALRGYVLMQKLEALGYATLETFPAAAFREQPAAGAVRFTSTAAFLARFEQESCYPVGTAQIDSVVRFEPLKEKNLTPPFVARVKIKLFDDESAKIVAALAHFARMQGVGGLLRNVLQYHDNELKVVNLNAQYPMYHPDVSAVRLTVEEGPAPRPGQKPGVGVPVSRERAAQLRKADALVASMKSGVKSIVRAGRKAEATQQYSALTGEDLVTSREVVERFVPVTSGAQTPVPVYANPHGSPLIYAVPATAYPPSPAMAPGSVQQRAIAVPQRVQ
ncbi:MAG: hypothetical protein EXR29_13150 [Betaproteobacteria bacterium]|nr:hypothetical protein [Betaproteobacteria bacterium]